MKTAPIISAQLAQSIKPKSLPKAAALGLVAIAAAAGAASVCVLGYLAVSKFASNKSDELAKQLVASFSQIKEKTEAKQFLETHKDKIKKLGIAQNFLQSAIENHPQTDELLKILMQCGADVTGRIPDVFSNTVLEWASYKASKSNVELILEKLHNLTDRPSFSEWDQAAWSHIEIFQLFLDKTDKKWCNARTLCRAAYDVEKVKLLIEKVPTCTNPLDSDQMPLPYAANKMPLPYIAKRGYLESVKELLQNDCCLEQKDRALNLTKAAKKLLQVDYLLERKIEKQDTSGRTYPLYVGTSHEDYQSIYEERLKTFKEIIKLLQPSSI